MSYTPKSWLTIAPYYNYYYSFYNTLNNKIRHSFHNVGIELRMMYKKIGLAVYHLQRFRGMFIIKQAGICPLRHYGSISQ